MPNSAPPACPSAAASQKPVAKNSSSPGSAAAGCAGNASLGRRFCNFAQSSSHNNGTAFGRMLCCKLRSSTSGGNYTPWVKVKTPQGSRGLIQQPQSAPGAIPPLPQVTAPQSLNLGQPQTPRTATMDDVRKVAKQMNWTDQQVIDHFKSKGVQITQ